MKGIKEHVIYYAYSYLLALLSIVYGSQLIIHPEILHTFKVYANIRDLFDHRFIGLFFVVIGVLYAIATAKSYYKLKQCLLPIFSFIWTFFGLSFLLTEPPNTVWAFSLGMALLSFIISLRGDFKHG